MSEDAERSYRPIGRSVVDVLADEHRQLSELCTALTEPHRRDSRLVEVLTAVASRHMSAEEHYLYPAIRASVPDGGRLADTELAADDALRRTLTAIEHTPVESGDFAGLADEVAARLRRHAFMAANVLHPRLHEHASEVDLIRLGNRVEMAEEAAPTRPHAQVPHRPPWNKMVEPLVGVADKVRDVLARRATHPDDL